MMKNGKTYIALLLVLFLMTGCSLGKFNAETNSIYVKKDGTVKGALVEDFSESYYDEAELEGMIKESVDAYNAGEEKVTIESFKVNDETARLIMNYASADDYKAYNEVELFNGTIGEAKSAGFTFEQEFEGIEEGNSISAETIKSLTQYNVIVFEEPVDVKTDSKILYVSSNAKLVDAKTARLAEGQNGPAYIVYE